MKILAALLLLGAMIGCDKPYQPISSLRYAHWSRNLTALDNFYRFSLVCTDTGEVVGTFQNAYTWYAQAGRGNNNLNNEYESAEDARVAVEKFADSNYLCGLPKDTK